MMRISLYVLGYFQELAQESLGTDDFPLLESLFEQLELSFRNEEFDLGDLLEDDYEKEFDFISALEKFDKNIQESDFYPHWGMNEDYMTADVDEEVVWEAFIRLVRSTSYVESLFYMQYLGACFLGGLWMGDFDKVDPSPLIEAYTSMKPKYIAHILSKGYHVTKGFLEEVDLTDVPEYLWIDNPNIREKDGKYYIMKRIGAAGGVAQSLETQDLEKKRGYINRLTGGAGKKHGGSHGKKKRRNRAPTREATATKRIKIPDGT